MQAIHFKCARSSDGGLRNLSYVKATKLWRSGTWDISPEIAESLVGGWVYLHQEKTARSDFGGRVHAFEHVQVPELPRSSRIVFVVEARPKGRGQRWRGRNHGMAWTSGPVEPSLPHELRLGPS